MPAASEELSLDPDPPTPAATTPKRKAGPASDIAEANAVTLSFLTPKEVLKEWQEWQIYRTRRATGAGSFPWTGQAARIEAGNIERALGQFPADMVAQQIRNAITKQWRGAGMEYLKAEPTSQQPTGRQTFLQADRNDRQTRRHGPEAIPVGHL